MDDDTRPAAGTTAGGGASEDTWSTIYTVIRDYAAQRNLNSVPYDQAEAMILKKGFTTNQLATCINEYVELMIWSVDESRTQIKFV